MCPQENWHIIQAYCLAVWPEYYPGEADHRSRRMKMAEREKNRRRNNQADMTIGEQLSKIAEDICMHYCKWPDQWDEEKEGIELSESEICSNCPITKII